ncbi:MAG: sigma-70 family RNA polymerase sigma factor [Rhodothermales bacterium]|nr:sigma-70 family RNA polymerase sigma factor [Rhodothermales bacterium]
MSNSLETDFDLVKSAANGDRNAFRRIVDRHESTVATTVIGMLGQTEEAKDVGLDVFVRFHRSLKQFRGDSSLRTYLTRIAINLCLNELKRRKRQNERFQPLSPEETETLNPNPETAAMQNERDEMVRAAIQQLGLPYRQVVVLRLVQGLSVRETSETLGIPVGTVLSRLSRGQKKLRELITPLLTNYDENY